MTAANDASGTAIMLGALHLYVALTRGSQEGRPRSAGGASRCSPPGSIAAGRLARRLDRAHRRPPRMELDATAGNRTRLDRAPMWARVWYGTPLVDRYAYAWLWYHSGWDVIPPTGLDGPIAVVELHRVDCSDCR